MYWPCCWPELALTARPSNIFLLLQREKKKSYKKIIIKCKMSGQSLAHHISSTEKEEKKSSC
jgi:hypothetical protein